ncbi:MAG TPA: multidrug ABC transporter ATP-binding protein [Anaerolineae bacterium]|nr:multidrug ABC transporter ATP-binding protein [Anaerolineae bacterium]
MNLLIKATNLRKFFGDARAVDGVSLEIAGGEIYGLVGPDGAGKTTTMRLLVGALRADSGQAEICGYNIEKQTEQARAQFGYLSQRFSLYEDLTVLENIRFFAEVRGLKPDEWRPRSLEILDFVGLEKFTDRRAGQLSGGMKQKLGLASALVTRPKVLLLDEPTTGVDPVTRQDFWQLVIRLTTQGEGVSVIISTPYMDEASRCHRVGFMKDGRIIAEDTPSKLRTKLNGRILELRGAPIKVLRRVSHQDVDVEDVQAFGDKLHVRVGKGKAQEVISRLKVQIGSEGGHVDELRVVNTALEDVFIALSESK